MTDSHSSAASGTSVAARVPGSQAVSNCSHIPALDGLRGIAVAGVLLFHTGNMAGGFLGVDLFFVLSGFLITGLLLREVDTVGKISLVSFWGRRIRRLFPALAVVLVVVTISTWILQRVGYPVTDPSMVRTTLSDGLWAQLNVINWHLLAQDASYWEAFGQPRIFEHLWSIAVEEQFYVVWPLVIGFVTWAMVRLCGRRHEICDSAVLTVSIVFAIVSLFLMMALATPEDPTRVYTGSDTRAFSLLAGAAATTAPARRIFQRAVLWSRNAVAWWIGALGVTILGFWVIADGTSTPGLFSGGLFAHAIACAFLIGLCAAITTSSTSTESVGAPLPMRTLQARPLRWLGGISYSLYLWHWPVIVLFAAEQYPSLPAWLDAVLVIAASLALATVSKTLVEGPIRFRARWARGSTGALVFLAVSVGLLALWLTLPLPSAPTIDVGEL